MSPRERKRLLVTLAAGAVLVLVSLVYAPAYGGVFIGDDRTLVAEDARWRAATLPELFTRPLWPDHAQSETRTSYYRPVVLASFGLDAVLGDGPAEYHFTNIAAHVVAVALLAVVARRLGAGPVASVIAALAWGLAPRLTEAVAWVGGRADVFAGAFALAALAASPDAAAERPRPGVRSAIGAAAAGLFLFLALASKEVAWAAVVALAVGGVVARDGEGPAERRARLLRLVAAVIIPTAAYAALRVPALVTTASHHRELPASVRAGVALEAVGRYAVMAVDPWRPRSSIGMLGEISTPYAVLGGAIVVAVAGALGLALRRRLRVREHVGLAVAGALSLVSTAAVLHVVPLTIASAVTADRYLYLPLAGVAIALAVAAGRLEPRRARVIGAAALASALATAWVTRARVDLYRDETAYWIEAAERAHPHNTAARTALAGVVREWGPTELGCRLFESVRAIQEASGATGTARHRRTRENLAACWMRVGRDAEARAILDDLLRAQPDVGRVHFALLHVYLHQLDFDGAARELRLAVRHDPSLDNDASYLTAHLDDARKRAAEFANVEARERDPLGYAQFLEHVGRSSEATAFWVRVAIAPDTPELRRAEARARLVTSAPPPVARRAFDACPDSPPDIGLVHRLKRRERRWDEVTRHLARIEGLVGR